MKTIDSFRFPDPSPRGVIAMACAAALLVSAYSVAHAQQEQPLAPAAANEAPPIPADQLDSLVAPIALYPDPLLAQTLAASTYPLEVIQLEQWYANNKYLKDKALADAVAKQPWDPSVQALVAFPDVVQRMAGNIQWTTDLGNAFLAQQSDVMDAVQRMRAKAQGTGNLKTNAQQKVETQTVEGGQQAIVIEQANPRCSLRSLLRPADGLRSSSSCLSLLSLHLSGVLRRHGAGLRNRTCFGRRVGQQLGQLRLEARRRKHQQQQ